MAETQQLGSWSKRRRVMYAVLAFSMAIVTYEVWKDSTTAVAQTAVTMGFWTMISITGAYVFGATWDDKNIRAIK